MKGSKNSHLKYLSTVTNILAIIVLFTCGIGVFASMNTKLIATIVIGFFMFCLGVQTFFNYTSSNKNYLLIVSILCMIISLFNLYLVVEKIVL